MPTNVFSKRVNDDISALFKGPAQYRCGNRVINNHWNTMLMRHIRQRLDINDITGWVANRLAEEGFSIVIN